MSIYYSTASELSLLFGAGDDSHRFPEPKQKPRFGFRAADGAAGLEEGGILKDWI
uniref:Uncharacterized protein n=1 Tax=Oryza punctata TaxID=4537 RepID=A0A1V1H922_ORYPU|nr:hypothetical protein [Oryza punctata]